MKTKLTLSILLAVFLSFNTSLLKAANETRNVEAFNEISLHVPAKLYLQQGPKQSIQINAKNSTLEQIRTDVKGRELSIHFPAHNLFHPNFIPGEIEIHITVPDISALTISGSGKIYNQGPIHSRILNINISGSGDLKLDQLVSERVKLNISGSGTAQLKGPKAAEDMSVKLSGSGDLKSVDFPVSDVDILLSGSGNVFVNAKSHLKIRVAGSGDVRYTGHPLIDKSIVGSGTVKPY